MSSNRVRFGVFEFDLTTLEISRLGAPINLQSQPAKVLAVLLEHAGEVVTRETLQSAVWKDDTHVDFDRGLNFCIAQIRAALGDSADSPVFLRTLPKRGYQFIAPVEKQPVVPAPATVPVQQPPKPRGWRAAAMILVVLAAFGIYGVYFWTATDAPAATPPIKIAVALFDNETGNPELDQFVSGLTDQVVAELTMSGIKKFEVIGNANILRVPRDKRDLNAITSELEASYIVLGQLQSSDNRVRMLAHLIRMPDQTHLWVTRRERTLDDPLAVQSELARLVGMEFTGKLLPENQ